tara:strand:- start:1226 stop:1483 length:258 start_codon:yes stop_codon:yes gene_type:complete
MKILINIIIGLIKIYKLLISPYIRPSCRYLPTCSEYFIDSLKEHGLFKGIFRGTKRILSCHPLKVLGGGSGFDPVKKNKGMKNGH